MIQGFPTTGKTCKLKKNKEQECSYQFFVSDENENKMSPTSAVLKLDIYFYGHFDQNSEVIGLA